MRGLLLFRTVTVNEHDAVFIDASVATYVTSVTPTVKFVFGACPVVRTVVTAFASVPTGSVKFTRATHVLPSRSTTMSAGHEMTGGIVSGQSGTAKVVLKVEQQPLP